MVLVLATPAMASDEGCLAEWLDIGLIAMAIPAAVVGAARAGLTLAGAVVTAVGAWQMSWIAARNKEPGC